jgi:Flp pilus assembly pilin Flp
LARQRRPAPPLKRLTHGPARRCSAIPTITRHYQTLTGQLLRLVCRAHTTMLRSRQDGVSMAEYILMTAAVLIIALAAINGFFNAIAAAFRRLTQRIGGTG